MNINEDVVFKIHFYVEKGHGDHNYYMEYPLSSNLRRKVSCFRNYYGAALTLNSIQYIKKFHVLWKNQSNRLNWEVNHVYKKYYCPPPPSSGDPNYYRAVPIFELVELNRFNIKECIVLTMSSKQLWWPQHS